MNNLFKALLIIILGAFLYLYYQSSENARYQYIPNEHAKELLDTKTGKIYTIGNINPTHVFIYDLPNLKVEVVEIK